MLQPLTMKTLFLVSLSRTIFMIIFYICDNVEGEMQQQRPLAVNVMNVKMQPFPFQNPSLPWDVRVNDLVSRLTLHEIQLQMSRGGAGAFGGPAPAIPRLGIGAYSWDAECLRGDVNPSGNATAFPQALGLAASFNTDLIYKVANATATEVRGKHNDYVKSGVFTSHTGASCFSPVINIMRDPRWGRNQETYGEDPYLTGELARSFVKGLQGSNKRFIRVNAGCKHFDVHGGPDNIPVTRFSFDAVVSEQDWRMTFLPAFKKCVEANTYSIMCSYNRINGVPACANKKLLTDILRNEWGFTGYVVSDEGAIENIISRHHYLNNSVDTVAACVNAGCNLELSENLVNPVYMSLGNERPIVLLLFSAGPLNISFAEESECVKSIMQCFFPAQATGDAIVKTLIRNGSNIFSPAGRLPFTWPLFFSQIPPIVNYSMEGRTYRYSRSTPLYPFGYGLAYTTFQYSEFSFPREIQAKEKFEVNFTLMNTGQVGGDEVTQCYVSWENQKLPTPLRQLAFFKRLFIPAGEKVLVTAKIPWETLAFWESGQWVIAKGIVDVYCGGQQPFQVKKAPSNMLTGKVMVTSTLKEKSL